MDEFKHKDQWNNSNYKKESILMKKIMRSPHNYFILDLALDYF
jgi:hypothetical protein